MSSVFLIRCLSGLVYVSVLLSALWFRLELALVFWFIITLLAFYEIQDLLCKIGICSERSKTPFYIQLLCLGLCFYDLYLNAGFTFISGISFLLYFTFVIIRHVTRHTSKSLIKLLFAHLYTMLSFVLVSVLLVQDFNVNKQFIFFLMCCIWSSDSLAYVCGSLFGKHKMAPSISPGKTWEGSIGALLLTLLWVYFISATFASEFWYVYRILLAFVIVVCSVIGDLFESKLKRLAKVKDSGNIMPGHGGVLDRMDSFMLAVPVVYVLIQVLNRQ